LILKSVVRILNEKSNGLNRNIMIYHITSSTVRLAGGTAVAKKAFGAMVPTKPIENKVQLIIDAGLESLNLSEDEAR
jgi:hypothetical protein